MTGSSGDAVADCIEEAARYLATEPAAVMRALAAHRPGGEGDCLGCGQAATRRPCAIRASAERANELIRRR